MHPPVRHHRLGFRFGRQLTAVPIHPSIHSLIWSDGAEECCESICVWQPQWRPCLLACAEKIVSEAATRTCLAYNHRFNWRTIAEVWKCARAEKIDALHSTEKVVNGSRHSTCLVGKNWLDDCCAFLSIQMAPAISSSVSCFLFARSTQFSHRRVCAACGETWLFKSDATQFTGWKGFACSFL